MMPTQKTTETPTATTNEILNGHFGSCRIPLISLSVSLGEEEARHQRQQGAGDAEVEIG
jgi:hypothetical protein